MLALLLLAVAPPVAPVVPLRHAHAHNDYAQARPLVEALERGFTSVEADIFLMGKELRIGHIWLEASRGPTLEKLYLEPLRKHVRACKGKVYPDGSPFYLHIDIKTDASKTWAVLEPLLARYQDILSVTREGRFTPGAVTVVTTGNCPREAIRKARVRYAGIDGRPGDLDSDEPAHLIPHLSASWGSQFRWRGEGAMPELERQKLRDYVARAHRHGRLVRFWATPENPLLWKELRAAGVDLINTDRLRELQQFLLAEKGQRR